MADDFAAPYGRDRFLEQLTELVQRLEFTSGLAGPQVQASGDIAATLDDLRKRIKDSAEAFAKSLDRLADKAETAEKRYHYQAGAALARRSGEVSDEELFHRAQQAQGRSIKSSVESYLDRLMRARLGQFAPSGSDYLGLSSGGGAARPVEELPWQKAFREMEEERVRKEQDRQRAEEEYQARRQEDEARAAEARRQEAEADERRRKESEDEDRARRAFFQDLHERGADEQRAAMGNRAAIDLLASAAELAKPYKPPKYGRGTAAALPAEHVPGLIDVVGPPRTDWNAWAEAEQKVFQIRKKEPELYEKTARTLDSHLGLTAIQVGLKLKELPGVAMAGVQQWAARMDYVASLAARANPNIGATYQGSKGVFFQELGFEGIPLTGTVSAELQILANAMRRQRRERQASGEMGVGGLLGSMFLGIAPHNILQGMGVVKPEDMEDLKTNMVNMSPSRTLSAEQYSDVLTQAGFQRQDLGNREAQEQMRAMADQMQSLHEALEDNTRAVRAAQPLFHS